jgi:hypothetical protein
MSISPIVPRIHLGYRSFNISKVSCFFTHFTKKGKKKTSMKKNFKKSKIIVPALALITATTVASVSGTVAWYTASRTATVTASEFASTSLSSSLKVSTTALVGTKDATSAAATTATISVDGEITHGSYNAQAITDTAEGNLYVATLNDDGDTVVGYADKGTVTDASKKDAGQTSSDTCAWLADSYTTSGNSTTTTTRVWYAVAWKMTFSIDTLGNHGTGLFIDYKTTNFTDSLNGEALQGFRIALMVSSNYKVIGGLDSGESHVKSAWNNNDEKASDHVTSFDTGVYHKYGEIYTKATDSESTTAKANTGYLVDFDSTKSVNVTAVAWFEGEDTSIQKDKTMSKVAANLSFYTRNYTA